MQQYTLRELCRECGVTRRAVQWYEKYGLVCSCGKTNRCYLLYDKAAIDKVKEIKSLQNYGFKVSEIKEYLNSAEKEQKMKLKQKCAELKQKSSRLISYIKEVEILLNKGEN